MPNLIFNPVSKDTFSDLATFFEQHGNPNYCWCMRWRVKSTEFQKAKSKERRSKLQSFVQNNIPIGVMAYHQDKVVGWCSIAPRETYSLLEGSTTLKRIDNLPVWSVVCFFVDPNLRRQNLPIKLLQAATKYAFSQGATIVEGYPVEPDKSYRFMGSPSTFEKAGFQEAGIAKKRQKDCAFVFRKITKCKSRMLILCPSPSTTAQQSVHLTCGILRHFQAFSSLRVFSALRQNPRPPTRR